MRIVGKFPNTRLRRVRNSKWMRKLISENDLNINDLILPIFVREGKNKIEPIKMMPGINRYSIDKLYTVMDKVRKEHKLEEYKVKVFDPDWTGETFMLKAMECVKKYKTLPNFFTDIEIPLDNETNGETEDSKDELPSQKPKESEGFPQTIFQG